MSILPLENRQPDLATDMNRLTNRGIGRQQAELNLLRSNSSNRCGLDHRDNASTNGLGQLGPGGRDHGQVWVLGHKPGSAFSSTHRTRNDVYCRYLAEIVRVDGRRNFVVIREFIRLVTPPVACRRMFTKNGGGGNCTRLRRRRPGPFVSRLGFSTRPYN